MYKLKFQKILLNFKLISFLLFKKKIEEAYSLLGYTQRRFPLAGQIKNLSPTGNCVMSYHVTINFLQS
jgi:hypothetical protein